MMAIDDAVETRIEFIQTLEPLFSRPALAQAVIDVPIGLPTSGARCCDKEARRLLQPPRASSVFPAPIRAVLPARSQKEASDLWWEAERKRCTAQLAAILPKIRDVDGLITPARQSQIREGHPEVSFAVMNNGRAMSHPKRRSAGREERLTVLEKTFPGVRTQLAGLGSFVGDAVDALAMHWTARRVASGQALVLPKVSQVDDQGLRMEIVA
jgi:predicted RNase H-like nuclease